MALMIREYFSVESGLVPMMLGRLDAGLYLNFCKPSKLPSLGKHEIRFYRTECTARVCSHINVGLFFQPWGHDSWVA